MRADVSAAPLRVCPQAWPAAPRNEDDCDSRACMTREPGRSAHRRRRLDVDPGPAAGTRSRDGEDGPRKSRTQRRLDRPRVERPLGCIEERGDRPPDVIRHYSASAGRHVVAAATQITVTAPPDRQGVVVPSDGLEAPPDGWAASTGGESLGRTGARQDRHEGSSESARRSSSSNCYPRTSADARDPPAFVPIARRAMPVQTRSALPTALLCPAPSSNHHAPR